MESQLDFVLNLPLEDIALRRMVVDLWNESDILDFFLLEGFRFDLIPVRKYRAEWRADVEGMVKCSEKWREIIEKVKDKVTKLELPKLLREKMMLLVKIIGLEMLRGILSLREVNLRDILTYENVQILKQLCWTSAGAVDYRRTAEKLVSLETLDILKRYRLACLNCLVDRIPDLWEALPEEYKICFYDLKDPFRENMPYYEFYWFGIVKGKESEMKPSVNQEGFQYAAVRGNKAATQYFCQKLTNEERDSCLNLTICEVIGERFRKSNKYLHFFPKESLSGVLCYLLSVMSPEQQMQVIVEYPCHILKCFLDWPLQDLFLNTADVIWTFLPEVSYKVLLDSINGNFKSSGYYFPGIFQKFFLRSPSNFRKYFVGWGTDFFLEFFKCEDAETIIVVFRNLDVEDKMRLVSSCEFFKVTNGFVMENKWDLVKLCLREASESLEDRERVKRAFMGYLTWVGLGTVECKESKWKEFFESLGEDDARTRIMRSLEDGTRTEVLKTLK